MRRLRRGGFHYDFIGRKRRWFAISGVVLVVSAGALVFRGFNLGLEFKGGTALQVEAGKNLSIGDIEKAVKSVKIETAVVQRQGQRGFLVQTEHLGAELQQHAAEQIAKAAGVKAEEVSVTDVGPKWGRQITNKAIRALVVFLVIVSLYISLRFEPKMAGAAMVALVHDLLVTAGIYALTGFAVTPATVIAILTIMGYSLYDTIIIFDRVKERTGTLSAAGRQTYSDVANESLNQVLVRSLNTSLMGLLPVGSLLFVGSFLLGAHTLRELALALFVGMAVGTYSSIFVAAPVLAAWKEREQRWATLRGRIAARAAEPAPRTAPRAETPSEPVAAAAARGGGRPGGGGSGSQRRPPQRRKKKKRRR